MMRDADIRQALRSRLAASHANEPDARVLDELGICQGRVRIDLAVVNGRLNGFEIKSDQDTLGRLDEQQRLYSKVFDEVTIVTHGAHLKRIADRVPSWWGITEAVEDSGAVALGDLRAPRQNPNRDAFAIVQLLWRSEVLELLERYGLARGVQSKPRREAWTRAAERIPLPELAAAVRLKLKHRPHWREQVPPADAPRT